jgi:glycine/D-amino acid oxidase-like deaminating enzyme
LLEKAQLTHGSTWHAAGLVGQLRSKRNLTRLMQNSVALYRTLERDTGQAIDWHEVGSVRLASSAERWSELKRAATTARGFNFEMELISPKEAQERFPYITLDGIAGAAWVPSDGYVDH